jgi:hypothetical protein
MKTPLFRAAALAGLMLAGTAAAQTTAPAPPPREPPSNDATGVRVDDYVAYADRTIPHVSHDVMIKRTLLTEGPPDGSGAPRAVLSYHKEVAILDLAAGNVTTLARFPEQLMFYVQSGTGTFDDGRQEWDLKPGIAILVPPNAQHRLSNTGDTPMKMVMVSRMLEPTVTPRRDILVRDVNRLAYTERNVHWSNMTKYVFLAEDGLYETDHFYIVYMPPWTIAGPHAHTPGQEEVWIKLTDAPAIMQMGSEIRPWPAFAGFMVPPNGRTVHAAINNSDEMQAWFYYSRLQPTAAPRDPSRPPRPEAAAIAEGVVRATVAGRPIERSRGR